MQAEFQHLTIPTNIFANDSKNSCYKVFSDIDNFVEIQADTATDAIIKSKIEEPFKVLKNSIGEKKILDIQDIISLQEENNETNNSIQLRNENIKNAKKNIEARNTEETMAEETMVEKPE